MYLGNDGCVELKSVTRLSDDQHCFAAKESDCQDQDKDDENSADEGSRCVLDFNQNSESSTDKSLQGKLKKQLNDGINLATRQIRDRKQLMNRASEFIFPPKSNNVHGTSESISGTGRHNFLSRPGEAKVSCQNPRMTTNFIQPKDNQNLKRNSTIGKSFKLSTRQFQVVEQSPKDVSHNQDKLIQDLNVMFSSRAKLHHYRCKSKAKSPPKANFHNRFTFRDNFPPAPGRFEFSRRGQNSRESDSSFSSDDSL